MRFGDRVWVERGSAGRPAGKPGCLRRVRGVLLFARKHNRFVRLVEDDPQSTIPEWSHAGDIGHWSGSLVFPRTEGSENGEESKKCKSRGR
jgi:hypothetical protein